MRDVRHYDLPDQPACAHMANASATPNEDQPGACFRQKHALGIAKQIAPEMVAAGCFKNSL